MSETTKYELLIFGALYLQTGDREMFKFLVQFIGGLVIAFAIVLLIVGALGWSGAYV